jgi:hypothetical protein
MNTIYEQLSTLIQMAIPAQASTEKVKS